LRASGPRTVARGTGTVRDGGPAPEGGDRGTGLCGVRSDLGPNLPAGDDRMSAPAVGRPWPVPN